MATLTKRTRGGSLMFEIRFWIGKDRKTIPLGKKYTERTANEMLAVVEMLIHCQTNGIEFPGKKTVAWIEHASDELRQKLAKAGLIDVPEPKKAEELWTSFVATKGDIKESTHDTYSRAESRFFMFFDRNEDISELTRGRMEQWKDFLRTKAPRDQADKLGLAESTVAGTLSKTKAVFNWAVKVGWIEKSPLEGVGRGSFVNRDNDRFITIEEYHRLLDVCPCQDWRTIISLVRIGGLRCPSEVLSLRWSDVNWAKDRFYVTSAKTERYKGKEGRFVPLFQSLREELDRLFLSESTAGTEFVINRYRDPQRTNLGTQFARIVKMAGMEPVKRPFDNMRASRSTEVYAEHGAFLESQWIGHSHRIAMEHYLQVREEDFTRAVGGKQEQSGGKNAPNGGFPPLPKFLPPLFSTSIEVK